MVFMAVGSFAVVCLSPTSSGDRIPPPIHRPATFCCDAVRNF
jgi:hypothetical protein